MRPPDFRLIFSEVAFHPNFSIRIMVSDILKINIFIFLSMRSSWLKEKKHVFVRFTRAERVRVNIIHSKTVKKVPCNLKLWWNPFYVVLKKRYRIVTFYLCIVGVPKNGLKTTKKTNRHPAFTWDRFHPMWF